jgi:hypothetical protein
VIGAVSSAAHAEILHTPTLRLSLAGQFSLRLAERVVPDRPWRIITSDSHSRVSDGDELLFNSTFERWVHIPKGILIWLIMDHSGLVATR